MHLDGIIDKFVKLHGHKYVHKGFLINCRTLCGIWSVLVWFLLCIELTIGFSLCQPHCTVWVLNFVGKIFMFLVGNKIRGVLIFVAMAEW